MKIMTEIYWKKENIMVEDWECLIKEVSKYHGLFQKWKLLVRIENHKIQYFIETKISLPIIIDSLEFCIFHPCLSSPVILNRIPRKIDYFSLLGDNLITIYDKFLLKKGIVLNVLEIIFYPINIDKIYSKSYLYLEKDQVCYKRKLFLSTPTLLLNISFQNQKKFQYKKIPKYFNIQKCFDILKKESSTSILNINPFPYDSSSLFLNVDQYDFSKHSLILGSSGSGKSKLLSSMISKLKEDDYKVIIIDPHASLEQEIGGLSHTIKVDFKTEDTTVNLFKAYGNDTIASVELLLFLFQNLMSNYYNPKLERVLRHSLHLLLLGNCFNFTALRRLILDIEYRNEKLNNLQEVLPQTVLDFFYTDFNELKTKSYMESIAPILSLVDEMQLLPAFNTDMHFSCINDILSSSFLTIFSLDRTSLGDHIVKTITGFVMQQILEIIQTTSYQKKVILVVDEIAVVENPILIRMLSESRKYGFSLILISQYFNQITPDLKDAIFANTINYYIFRVSRVDATLLVDHLNMDIPEANEKEYKIKVLTELNNRECIVRVASCGKLKSAFKATTLDFKAFPYKSKSKRKKTKIKQEMNMFLHSWKESNTLLKDVLKTISTNKRK